MCLILRGLEDYLFIYRLELILAYLIGFFKKNREFILIVEKKNIVVD